MSVAVGYFVGGLVVFLVWLAVSEVLHRRYIRRYREETDRLYPPSRSG